MKSSTTKEFWDCFDALPADVQEQARKSYRLWIDDPKHPSLHFKKIHATMPVFSARVGRRYRAVGVMTGTDEILWYWIGTHAEYDRIVKSA